MLLDSRQILLQRRLPEVLMVGDRDALVNRVVAAASAVFRVAVAGEVLRGGQHPVAISEMARWSLEPVDGRLHLDDQLRVLTEALVGCLLYTSDAADE